MNMKTLIRRMWLRIAKWLDVDFAEMLSKREQSAVSLERAKVEYEKVVDRSIREGKFANVLWGRNHMPDDDLDQYMQTFNEKCGKAGSESAGSIIVDRGKTHRPSFIRSSGSVIVSPESRETKPARQQVNGEWPIDETCNCIVADGKVYTGNSLKKYVADHKKKKAAEQAEQAATTSIVTVGGCDYTLDQIKQIIKAGQKKPAKKKSAKKTAKKVSRRKAA